MIVYTQILHLACKAFGTDNFPENLLLEFMITVCYPLCMVIITVYTLQWRIQKIGKGGSKLSSAKREELNLRKARKIWGYAHFR